MQWVFLLLILHGCRYNRSRIPKSKSSLSPKKGSMNILFNLKGTIDSRYLNKFPNLLQNCFFIVTVHCHCSYSQPRLDSGSLKLSLSEVLSSNLSSIWIFYTTWIYIKVTLFCKTFKNHMGKDNANLVYFLSLRNWGSYVKSGFCQELSWDERVAELADLSPDSPYNMSPGQRLVILSLLLLLLFLSIYYPSIPPSTPCTPLKPLSRLQDLPPVWRQKAMCGLGTSLQTLYQVDEEEAGPLILPKPLSQGWLVEKNRAQPKLCLRKKFWNNLIPDHDGSIIFHIGFQNQWYPNILKVVQWPLWITVLSHSKDFVVFLFLDTFHIQSSPCRIQGHLVPPVRNSF